VPATPPATSGRRRPDARSWRRRVPSDRRGQELEGLRGQRAGLSLVSILGLYLLQLEQGVLPLSNDLAGVSPSVASNTAIPFVTDTDRQSGT
jgi:hypothetical protein